MGMKYKDPVTGQLKELSLKAADTLPIGSVIAYSGSNEPSGWLICDGRAISRTNYSNLFNVIGTTYGAGDGSTTFNLPDYRDRVPVGLDSNDSDFDTLGKTGGEKTHKLTINEMPAHDHNVMKNTNDNLVLMAQAQNKFGDAGTGTGFGWYWNKGVPKQGGGQAHNNLQPYIVTNYIIKAEKSVGVLGKILNIFSNSDKDTYSCDYVNGLAGKVLWNNPDPTGDFPSQTITLNSDDFDVYEVFYYISTENLQMESCKSLKGHGTRLMIPSTNMEFRRMNSINNTTYSFETPSNVKFGVPIKIIGYKTGLFN